MSKSQSKEFFKKKQRGRTKKTTSVGAATISTVGASKNYHLQTSQGNSSGLLNGGEDPAVVVIHPHPSNAPNHGHHVKEKRTKICCLL